MSEDRDKALFRQFLVRKRAELEQLERDYAGAFITSSDPEIAAKVTPTPVSSLFVDRRRLIEEMEAWLG